ncbi:MAG: hypothetical protein JSV51_06740 [Candidatus Bathyarchaeota archaeon]|nr:MAG: hypothetical protein JSV51_06740 [Candidatus Bathyarchaeota archaeon]
MEKSLAKSKLFGTRDIVSWDSSVSTKSIDSTIMQNNNPTIEKALSEAERKKAEAITMLRHYSFR